MVKLSIIIPYYNTFELTKKLLMNLIIQINEEVEVFVIDDGCNETKFDEYLDFLDKRGFTYKNCIHIIHQENKGVAKSRNLGIDLSHGKYIAFIDSDDMIMPNYIETLLNAINKYDTDVINFNWYNTELHVERRKPTNYAVWKAIYKKQTIPKFIENMKYGAEDVPFQKIITNGNYSITYLDKLLYLYNTNREGSLMWNKSHEEKK